MFKINMIDAVCVGDISHEKVSEQCINNESYIVLSLRNLRNRIKIISRHWTFQKPTFLLYIYIQIYTHIHVRTRAACTDTHTFTYSLRVSHFDVFAHIWHFDSILGCVPRLTPIAKMGIHFGEREKFENDISSCYF